MFTVYGAIYLISFWPRSRFSIRAQAVAQATITSSTSRNLISCLFYLVGKTILSGFYNSHEATRRAGKYRGEATRRIKEIKCRSSPNENSITECSSTGVSACTNKHQIKTNPAYKYRRRTRERDEEANVAPLRRRGPYFEQRAGCAGGGIWPILIRLFAMSIPPFFCAAQRSIRAPPPRADRRESDEDAGPPAPARRKNSPLRARQEGTENGPKIYDATTRSHTV